MRRNAAAKFRLRVGADLSVGAQDPEPAKQRPRRALNALPLHPRVVDNFSDTVPVGQRELDVIETYLGAYLNALYDAQK